LIFYHRNTQMKSLEPISNSRASLILSSSLLGSLCFTFSD
jgi:hypothetical protein